MWIKVKQDEALTQNLENLWGLDELGNISY